MNLGFENVDRLCTSVDISAEKPVIDLSPVTFFQPFALVYLGMFLRHHNLNGKSFSVILPENARARNYLAQQNFWERFNFSPEAAQKEKLRCFSGNTSLNDIVDIEHRPTIAEEITEQVRKVLVRNNVKIHTGLVSELMCELVDNFALHSRCVLAVVAMQYYPNLHRIIFSVGDCGIGIRSSLASNPIFGFLSDRPHYEAALKAFEPLVSRMSEGGTGLTEVKEEIINLNGRLTLATGDGYVIIEKENTRYGQMAYDLPGVQIQLSFPDGRGLL